MTEPQYWVATEDPSLDLAAWLDEQVRQAVIAYVEDGYLCVERDGTVRFCAPEELDRLFRAEPLGEFLTEWCLDGHVTIDGDIRGKERDTVTTFRNTLAAVVAQMDAALAKSAS